MTLRRGETLLLTIGIPVVFLLFFSRVSVVSTPTATHRTRTLLTAAEVVAPRFPRRRFGQPAPNPDPRGGRRMTDRRRRPTPQQQQTRHEELAQESVAIRQQALDQVLDELATLPIYVKPTPTREGPTP